MVVAHCFLLFRCFISCCFCETVLYMGWVAVTYS